MEHLGKKAGDGASKARLPWQPVAAHFQAFVNTTLTNQSVKLLITENKGGSEVEHTRQSNNALILQIRLEPPGHNAENIT